MSTFKPSQSELLQLYLKGVTKPILCTHFNLPVAKVVKAIGRARRNSPVNRTHSLSVLRQAGYMDYKPNGRPGTPDAIKEKVIALWKEGKKYGEIGAEFDRSDSWAGFIIRAHPDYEAPLQLPGRPPKVPKEESRKVSKPAPTVATKPVPVRQAKPPEPKPRKHQQSQDLPPRPADFDLRTWPVLGPGDRPDAFDKNATGYFDADVFGEKRQYSTCLI